MLSRYDSVHEDDAAITEDTDGGADYVHCAESCLDATQRQAPLPRTDLLVPLTEPVPDNWVTKEGNFHLVCAAMMPMVINSIPQSIYFTDPSTPFEAGSVRLIWSSERFSRSTAAKTMIGSHEITTADKDKFVRVDVKAFRLEPETAPGNMSVDGDLVPYGPIQCQVHQGLVRVMSRRRKT